MFILLWRFLYNISKALFQVTDWLAEIAFTIMGIEPITVNGKETDFLTYLITSDKVKNAFGATFVMAIIILSIFSVFAIIRQIAKDQPTQTPAQIVMIVVKNLLMFLFVPTVMLTLTWFMTAFMKSLFAATSDGGTSIGAFMFTVFAADAGLSSGDELLFLNGTYKYTSTNQVANCIDLAEFNFIMSWIVGYLIIKELGQSLVSFVERAISIVILYIAAPFSIAASVLDDGARFKTWRDQVLTKYLASYGIIIAINIYLMVCKLVIGSSVTFSEQWSLNVLAKIMIILGGALSLGKAHSLIGTLISQSAAADINDPKNAAGRALAGKLFDATPLGFVGGAVKDAAAAKLGELKKKIGDEAMGLIGLGGGGGGGGGMPGGGGGGTPHGPVPDAPEGEGEQNPQSPDYDNEDNGLKDALENEDEEAEGENTLEDELDEDEDDDDIADRGDDETEQMQNELASLQ